MIRHLVTSVFSVGEAAPDRARASERHPLLPPVDAREALPPAATKASAPPSGGLLGLMAPSPVPGAPPCPRPAQLTRAALQAWQRDVTFWTTHRFEKISRALCAQQIMLACTPFDAVLQDEARDTEPLRIAEDLYLGHLPQDRWVSRGGGYHLHDLSYVTALPAGIHVVGDCHLEHMVDLTCLPEDLYVGRDLRISGSMLRATSDGLCVGGDLRLESCRALQRVGRATRIGGVLTTGNSRALNHVPEDVCLGQGRALLEVILQEQKRCGKVALQNLVFSDAADAELHTIAEGERLAVVRVVQSLYNEHMRQADFADILACIAQLSPSERAEVTRLLEPLVSQHSFRAQKNQWLCSAILEVCAQPRAKRKQLVQDFVRAHAI